MVSVYGPYGTCYEGGLFNLKVTFSNDYPMAGPKVTFETSTYHPCVDENGKISMDLLDNWTLNVNMKKVLLGLVALFNNPLKEKPLRPELAELYKMNKGEYKKRASYWTSKHAC